MPSEQTLTREEIRGCPRAFIVREPEEGHCEVVYARNAMEARRIGAPEFDGAEEEYLEVERAPEFDDLQGRSMREVQLEHGWWFECTHCSRRVDEYAEWYDVDTGETVELEPTVRGNAVYCSPWCVGAERVRTVERRIRTWDAIEWAVQRFPGCRILMVNPNSYARTHDWNDRRLIPTVTMTLPPKHKGEFEVQRECGAWVRPIDMDEWNAYQASHPPIRVSGQVG